MKGKATVATFRSTNYPLALLTARQGASGRSVRADIMATFSSLEYGKADFVLLDELTEDAFMQNLKLRFQKGKIYTYIGNSRVELVNELAK